MGEQLKLVPSEVRLVESVESLEKTKAELQDSEQETLSEDEKNEKLKELL